MMKFKLLAITFFPLFVFAQNSMRQFYELNSLIHKYDYFDEAFISTHLRKKLEVKSIKTITHPKNKKTSTAEYTYNKMGKNTSFTNKRFSFEKQYIADTLEAYVRTKSRGKIFEAKSTYSDHLLTTREIYKNGKLTSRYKIDYNPNQKVIQSSLVRKSKKFEIQNLYNDENKLIKTIYLINGKIKKQWIYECKPEGEVVASKSEALSSFCNYKEESADGSYTTFTRTLKEGKPYLNKQVFNKDSILVSSKTFLNDTILIWERSKVANVETTISYKKSGKINYKQIVNFDNLGNVTSREFLNRNKSTSYSKREFKFNTNGTVSSETVYHKGKFQKSIDYEYTFYK